MRLGRRRIALALLLTASVTGAAALAACVIADPPPDVPAAQKHHPNIVHGGAFPPDDRVLTTWPSQFIVPIELTDPTACFNWRVFVDFDSLVNPSEVLAEQECPPFGLDGGVDLIDFYIDPTSVPQLQDGTQCHVVEFVVALGFRGNSAHTPDSYGADSVHWFYNPAGDVGACATYDAGGVDGGFPSDATDVLVTPPGDGGGL